MLLYLAEEFLVAKKGYRAAIATNLFSVFLKRGNFSHILKKMENNESNMIQGTTNSTISTQTSIELFNLQALSNQIEQKFRTHEIKRRS
jgi:signal transduction histidine kinase